MIVHLTVCSDVSRLRTTVDADRCLAERFLEALISVLVMARVLWTGMGPLHPNLLEVIAELVGWVDFVMVTGVMTELVVVIGVMPELVVVIGVMPELLVLCVVFFR